MLEFAIHSYDAPDACGVVTRNASLSRAGATHLWLHFTGYCGPDCRGVVWPAPGTYSFGMSPSGDAGGVGGAFTARLESLDANCSGAPQDATGGTVTIVAVSGDVLDATYDLDFASGHVKGALHASTCAAACGLIQQTTCARN